MIKSELETVNRSPEMNEALTHASYANEHNIPYSNQRLEFLGDAILGAVISEYLVKIFPDEDEGMMTKLKAQLTCANWCTKIADKLNLKAFLKIGNGLNKQSLPESILADAMESVIGAYFLTHGWKATKNAILEIWEAETVDEEGIENPKGKLQEYCQKRNYKVRYRVDQINNDKFLADLYIGKVFVAEQFGKSKKEAEMKAASYALSDMGWERLVQPILDEND